MSIQLAVLLAFVGGALVSAGFSYGVLRVRLRRAARERRATLGYIARWRQHYPEEVFAPLRPEERNLNVSRDRVGAHTARYIFDAMMVDLANDVHLDREPQEESRPDDERTI